MSTTSRKRPSPDPFSREEFDQTDHQALVDHVHLPVGGRELLGLPCTQGLTRHYAPPSFAETTAA